MKSTFFITISICAVVSFQSCHGQNSKKAAGLDTLIKKKGDSLLLTTNVPGIFIGILNNGTRKYYSFGYADPATKMRFDSATLFEIGSITKTFTAYILEKVLHDRSISDTSPILSYLPDSIRQNTALQSITFLSLMNHTSGLPRLPDNIPLAGMSPYDTYTLDDLYSYLKSCTPGPPGRNSYSNLGAGLGGVLAQRIANKTYDELLNEYIYRPFKISAHPDESIDKTQNKAQGYFEDKKVNYWKAASLAPAGTLKSSATDLLTYLQGMITPVNGDAKLIISTVLQPTAIVTPQVKVCRGWHTREDINKPVIYWHNGGTYGFSSFAGFVKEKNVGVVVVSNRFNTNNTSDWLGMTILRELMQ